MNRLFQTMVAAAVTVVAVGCGQPELIDRTRPNYMKKSDLLDGTWYIQETVVDLPKAPSATTVVGYSGKMEKVRWEIQEDLLVAYRAYEIVPGADPKVDREKSSIGDVRFQDGRPYKGNPVFAYRIQSHFDRQRQYNASTGEQMNVLEENTTDRPWYEREFMRVDWSANILQNADADCGNAGPRPSAFGCLGDASGLWLRFVTAQDQQTQDQAMTMERDASGKLVYFDWVQQAVADPPSIYYEGYGNLPFCFFNPTVDCESVDVRVRVSVKKVDEARVKDYEPLVYNDRLNKKFGLFRQEAYAYSIDYRYTYSGQQFFAMRHNIWKQARDANGTPIPVDQRPLRPIVYYMTQSTPEFLFPTASQHLATAAGKDPKQTVEASWDHAYRRAVAVPRGLEASDVPQMFYVCESPVREGSPEACGPAGTLARIGDLRFNVIPYVEQISGGLLGLGPSSMDPETGEVVHAAANVYGPALDTWAGESMQMMDVLNGQVSLNDLVTGKDIQDYVFSHLKATDPRAPASGPFTSQQGLSSDTTKPMGSMANTGGRLRNLALQWRATGLPLAKEDRKATVARLLEQNPSLKSELVNLPEVRVAVQSLTTNAGFRAKLQSDSAFYQKVALDVLLGNDPIEKARENFKKQSRPEIGCFYEAYEDEDYVGVATEKLKLQQQLEQQYRTQGHPSCDVPTACTPQEATSLARDEVYNSLRREAYRSVTEHEIGHTLGLMHNFIGSADALNYKDGYWDLRKETVGVVVAGQRVLPVNPQNLLDASKQNQKQIEAGLYEYTYSSIMDYGARVTAQNKGVGKYDEAAILFSYGGGYEPGWVEVFNETRSNYTDPNVVVPVDNSARIFTVRGAHVELPLAHVEHYTPASTFYTDKYHYSTLPLHFADNDSDLTQMINKGVERMKNRSFRPWKEMATYYAQVEASLKDWSLSSGGLSETDYVRARDIILDAELMLRTATTWESPAPSTLVLNPDGTGTMTAKDSIKWTATADSAAAPPCQGCSAMKLTVVWMEGTMETTTVYDMVVKPNGQMDLSGGDFPPGTTMTFTGKPTLGPNAHIPVEVPYMFCSDYEVGANLLCNRNDQGADVYEMTSKWLERFDTMYPFLNFRRDKLIYSPAAVASRKFARYLGNVPNVYQQWLFNIHYLAKYYELSPEEMDKYYGLGDPIWQNYWTMAVVDSTNLLMQQLSIPSAGYHGQKTDGTWEYVPTGDPTNVRLEPAAEADLINDIRAKGYTDVLYVPRGPGRSMYTVYDTFGYDNFYRVNEAGHFWDVYAAILALITSETNFLGVDRGSDALRYSLPYYLTFNKELAGLFNAYWTQNVPYYSALIAKQPDGTGYVQQPIYLRAEEYVPGFVYPPPPPTPVDSNGNAMVLKKVAPVTTWSARFYAQVFSMA
ncbi:MAG: zinc-dependent metalloprotease, partial [Myxococcota bacterium]